MPPVIPVHEIVGELRMALTSASLDQLGRVAMVLGLWKIPLDLAEPEPEKTNVLPFVLRNGKSLAKPEL